MAGKAGIVAAGWHRGSRWSVRPCSLPQAPAAPRCPPMIPRTSTWSCPCQSPCPSSVADWPGPAAAGRGRACRRSAAGAREERGTRAHRHHAGAGQGDPAGPAARRQGDRGDPGPAQGRLRLRRSSRRRPDFGEEPRRHLVQSELHHHDRRQCRVPGRCLLDRRGPDLPHPARGRFHRQRQVHPRRRCFRGGRPGRAQCHRGHRCASSRPRSTRIRAAVACLPAWRWTDRRCASTTMRTPPCTVRA